MFNRLLSQNRIFIVLVLVLVFVASGLLYLNTVKRQADRDLQRTQERLNAPKPPPPGETAESGHWHGDVWHVEPHETEVPERDDSAESASVPATTIAPSAVAPSQPLIPSQTVPSVKLDPETQARVDALLEEAEALSAEADEWSNKLYFVDTAAILKEAAELKAEIAKRREMRRDPNICL